MKKLAVINSDPMDCNYGGVAPFLRNMHPYLSENFDVEYFTIPPTWTGRRIPGRIKMMYTLFKRRKEIKACDFALSHVPEGSYIVSFLGLPYCHILHGKCFDINNLTIVFHHNFIEGFHFHLAVNLMLGKQLYILLMKEIRQCIGRCTKI